MKIAITKRQITYHNERTNCLIITNTNQFNEKELVEVTKELLDLLDQDYDETIDDKVKTLLFPELGKALTENKEIKDALTYLTEKVEQEDDFLYEFYFDKETEQYYVVGIDRALPVTLAVKIKDAIKKGKEEKDMTLAISLINFWKWLSRNPDEAGIEDVLLWIKEQEIPILPSGLLLTFRRVVKVEGKSYNFAENINRLYLEQRRKKKTTDISVWRKEDIFSTHKEDGFNYVGNLKDLYLSLNSDGENNGESEEVYYTDNFSGKEKYFIGKESRMDRDKVDTDKNNSCSTGLFV